MHCGGNGYLGRVGDDPSHLEALVDDGALDGLDGHGVGVDAEHARSLARRRAHAARELREVVGEEQPVKRLSPPAREGIVSGR